MPIYEYECSDCGEKFELRRGMTERDAEAVCPGCASKNSNRILSIFAMSPSSASCAPSSST